MAVTFVNPSSGTFSTASPVITKPTGLASGHIWYAGFATDTTHAATAPSGWTVIQSIDTGTDSTLTVIRRVCDGTEGATVTLTNLFAASEGGCYGTVAYSGADNATPEAGSASAAFGSGTAKSGPSITPAVDNCMILQWVGGDGGVGTTVTPDASPVATERVDLNSPGDDTYLFCQEWLQGAAAAIALDATLSVTDSGCGIEIAVRPTAAAAEEIPLLVMAPMGLGA